MSWFCADILVELILLSLSLYHYSHFLNYFLLVTQAESLADFYEYCKGLELARNFQFPTLRQVPLCTELKYFSQCHLMNLINFILWISSRLRLFLQLWKNTLEKHPSLVPFRRDWWENFINVVLGFVFPLDVCISFIDVHPRLLEYY